MPESIAESLWTADDVAAYLKVSRSWVYHRAESGQLPHVRVGGLLRFQPSEIRAYVESLSDRSCGPVDRDTTANEYER